MTATMSLKRPQKPDEEAACDPARVRAKALDLLARREHSAGELRTKLRERGYESTAVEAVLSSLAQEKLLSDERFVQEFVAARVDLALAALKGASAEGAAAARRKRFGDDLPKDMQERARQARFLQQRGFSMDDIRKALKGDVEE
jgi:regulatory protein